MASSGLLAIAIVSGLFCGQIAYLFGLFQGFCQGFDLGANFGLALRARIAKTREGSDA